MGSQRVLGRWGGRLVLAGCVALGGCSHFRLVVDPLASGAAGGADELAERPALAPPEGGAGRDIWRTAVESGERRIVVSTEHRTLWLMDGSRPLLRAPVAVGRSEPLVYGGRRWEFETPRSVRIVRAKAPDPVWVPPAWHYYEEAVDGGLEAVHLEPGMRVELSGGDAIEVRGDQVGRINRHGNFWPFTPGREIIFDGRIFIPPPGTAQRRIPDVLGTHKLELGDGYLIHGTNERDSIGEAVSHGCIRMYNRDVARLYRSVEQGTKVYIY